MDLNFVETFAAADRSSLEQWQPGDAWLAGGTWLFSEPQPDVRRLLDLRAFDWTPLTIGDDGLEIAATCTLAELAHWPVPPDWPGAGLLAQTCQALLGSFKIWNEGTVGGNICLSLPAGPMTSLAASMDAVYTIWRSGGAIEQVPANRFVLGPGENQLSEGALLRSVRLPASALRSRTAFRQISLNRLGRSAAVVIGRRDVDTDAVVITVTAAVTRPSQLRFDSLPSAAELSAAIDGAAFPYFDDPHGDPVWRAHLTRVLAGDVLAELREPN